MAIPAEQDARSVYTRGREVRVLIVDDVADHVSLIRKFLSRSRNPRMRAESVSDPEEAVARILAEDFDAILLDYRLPGRSGLDVLREINRGRRKPVIILTNQGDERTAVECFHAGAYDYLQKDIAPGFAETLRLTIRELLTRRDLERQIERERLRSNAILESMTQMVCCIDADFRITAANRAFRWLVRGYIPAGADHGLPDPIGMRVEDLIHDPEIRAVELARLGRVLSQGTVVQEEIEIVIHGQERLFWAEASPLLVGGSIEGVTVSFTDLTEQRSARHDQLRLARAVDSSADGVAITDVDGMIEYVNPAYCHLTGYGPDELIGSPARFVQLPAEEAGSAALRERLTRGDDWRGELVNRRKDASIYFADTRIAPIRDDAGSLIGFVSSERDVTGRKLFTDELIKAREAAEESLRAKDMFLATVSHELRTPLTSIIGYADLVLMDPNLSENGRMFVESILRGGRTLKQLITNILDFSRIAAGKFYLDLQPVDVRSMIEDLLEMFRNTPDSDSPQISVEIVPDLPDRVLLDQMKVEQVLTNLISNAVKYGGKGGIRVSAGPLFERSDDDAAEPSSPGMLVISVQDQGPGIDREEQERIFEPFVQLEEGLVRRHGGTGLGLSIARRLTELMGGTIWVDSEPGNGSRFSIALPMAVHLEDGPPSEKRPPTGGPLVLALRPDGDPLPEEPELAAWGYDVRPAAAAAECVEGGRRLAAALVASRSGLAGAVAALESLGDRLGPEEPCLLHAPGADARWEALGWTVLLGRERDERAAQRLVRCLDGWRPVNRCVLVDPSDPAMLRWAHDAIGPRGIRVHGATDAVIESLEGSADEIALLLVDLAREPGKALTLWLRASETIQRLAVGLVGWDPAAAGAVDAVWTERSPGFGRDRTRRLRRILNVLHTSFSTQRARGVPGPSLPLNARAESPWSRSGPTRPVLVVEDHEENRALVSEMLQAMGLPWHAVASGAEAAAFVKRQVPSLVLMDIEMPGIDGYEATRTIHRLPGREHLPVVAVTAHVAPRDRRRCHEAGCVDFLPKPIERVDLARVLRRWVNAPEAVVSHCPMLRSVRRASG